jgi:hypothetical protein
MKNKIVYSIGLACLFVCGSYTIQFKKTSGAHPGSTGAPGDQTCAQLGCHADAQVTSNAVNNNTLIISSVDSSYIPGATYQLTLMVQGSMPTSKFGFEIVALKDSDSLNVGQFIITDPSPERTQIINHTYNSDIRYSVTHKTAGTAALASNFTYWTFDWKAPLVNEGKITFWYATNCTNNNGQNSGDYIFLHSFQIHPVPDASIHEIATSYDLKASYDKENNQLIVSYDLRGKRTVQLAVYDVAGKNVYNGAPIKLIGKQKQAIDLGNGNIEGTYLIQLNIDGHKATKKVLVH